jgi:hypothetical protein
LHPGAPAAVPRSARAAADPDRRGGRRRARVDVGARRVAGDRAA